MTIAPIPAIANGRCRNLMVYTGYGCVCVCVQVELLPLIGTHLPVGPSTRRVLVQKWRRHSACTRVCVCWGTGTCVMACPPSRHLLIFSRLLRSAVVEVVADGGWAVELRSPAGGTWPLSRGLALGVELFSFIVRDARRVYVSFAVGQVESCCGT